MKNISMHVHQIINIYDDSLLIGEQLNCCPLVVAKIWETVTLRLWQQFPISSPQPV